MDHRGETLIGFAGTHCDAFELLELAEEVLDWVPPFVYLLVDGERLCAARMLGDDGLGAAAARLDLAFRPAITRLAGAAEKSQ